MKIRTLTTLVVFRENPKTKQREPVTLYPGVVELSESEYAELKGKHGSRLTPIEATTVPIESSVKAKRGD